ncbi:single-strand binding protein [Thermanaeromonas toyohensis ToBE]|uniref:Single-stranded DNA-binding protein n=1 Tax=Thermanaeromonas toyohensis ToBE TaxID=698762 RepID=A0A1W1VSH7_9FIRM|nr:single-stranded DNA-binding protein [Thermanaeromonas toyohensis]SMB96308.1 single-strand binding protein [Thermanaeromonas toyohensis ToBE]
MLNRTFLIGRLATDPELQYTGSGVARAFFVLAVDRKPDAEGKKGTDFIPVVLWRKLAETCAAHLKKGRLVAVDGKLHSRDFQGKDGQRRRELEVVAEDVRFLDRPPEAKEPFNLDELGTEVPFDEDDLPF